MEQAWKTSFGLPVPWASSTWWSLPSIHSNRTSGAPATTG